jgi:hypothetical protein
VLRPVHAPRSRASTTQRRHTPRLSDTRRSPANGRGDYLLYAPRIAARRERCCAMVMIFIANVAPSSVQCIFADQPELESPDPQSRRWANPLPIHRSSDGDLCRR